MRYPDHASRNGYRALIPGLTAVQDKKQLPKALAKRKQPALQYALEREQWSIDLQQQCKAQYREELEQLQLQLTETRARHEAAIQALHTTTIERDSARRQVELLSSSLAKAESRRDAVDQPAIDVAARTLPTTPQGTRALKHVAVAVLGALAFGTLFTIAASHDAQSNVSSKQQSGVAAVASLENKETVTSKPGIVAGATPEAQTNRSKARLSRVRSTRPQQWGPPLLMTDANSMGTRVVFDPLVKETQQNLLVLGFDIGEADGFKGMKTRQAIAEFRALYIQDADRQIPDTDLAVIIKSYASLARVDADRFGIDRGVVAAIRLSSVRTGVNFSYLMKLAATESNFEPAIEAESSSATGIYQFTRDTWLNTLARHGTKYGLADYVTKIEYYITRSGAKRPMVRDKAVYRHLLELRKNPRISSMMAAESVLHNQQKLVNSFDRKPAQTDLYLTHFLGAKGAIAFLKALDKTPDTFAVDIFPEAARNNYGIFHPSSGNPRTVDEVYELFGKKFSTRNYDDLAVN